MKHSILTTLLLISISVSAQYIRPINELGLNIYTSNSYYPIDTIFLKADSIFKKAYLNGSGTTTYQDTSSVYPYFNLESFYSYVISASQGFTGNLVIDTNNVILETISSSSKGLIAADTVSVPFGTKFNFYLNNSSSTDSIKILTQEFKTFTTITYATDLPILEITYLDSSTSTRYDSIPTGFKVIDTLTIKDYSTTYELAMKPSNNSYFFDNTTIENKFNSYFYAVHAYTYPNPLDRIKFDLRFNNVLHKSISAYGNRFSFPTLADTTIVDSSTIVNITSGGPKDVSFFSTSEIFHTSTTIYIEKIVGVYETDLKDSKIQLYPNPAENKLYVKSETSIKDKLYFIYDLNGRAIIEENLQKNEIDIESLSKGMYLISIPRLGINQKFIKN